VPPVVLPAVPPVVLPAVPPVGVVPPVPVPPVPVPPVALPPVPVPISASASGSKDGGPVFGSLPHATNAALHPIEIQKARSVECLLTIVLPM
jgi:hypothetical protein